MIRRFLTRLLILVLTAACGYNWLQTQRLQAQVTLLRTQQNVSRRSAHHYAAPMPAQIQTPEARFSLPVLHRYHLQARWKRLRDQADAFRSTSKKVFHETI